MVADNAIDQALFEMAALNTLPPPAIVRPFVDLSSSSQKQLEKFNAQLQSAQADVDHFIEQGIESRKSLIEAFEQGTVEQRHLENLTRLAEALEEKATIHVAEMAAQFKGLKRMTKKLVTFVPKSKKEYNRLIAALEANSLREIEEYTDMALFLRALRSEYDPTSRGGLVFDNADDLAKYLDQLVA